jgi:hypothetical protein
LFYAVNGKYVAAATAAQANRLSSITSFLKLGGGGGGETTPLIHTTTKAITIVSCQVDKEHRVDDER